jgi:hypothetical protein
MSLLILKTYKMGTNTISAIKSTVAQLTKFFKGVSFSTVEGLLLYKRDEERGTATLQLDVIESPNGNLYFAYEGRLVRTPSDVYADLMDNGIYEGGDTVMATVYLRTPVEGITEEEIAQKYTNNPKKIWANYQREQGKHHLYVDTIIE